MLLKEIDQVKLHIPRKTDFFHKHNEKQFKILKSMFLIANRVSGGYSG